MLQVDNLQRNVQIILESMRGCVTTTSDLSWTPSEGFLTIIQRSILRRQFDSLEVISHLVSEGKGYAAGPLLRPACEELIWTKYLNSIPPNLAEELIICVGDDERYKSLHAQDDMAGRTVTKKLGLLPSLLEAEGRKNDRRDKFRTLGQKLRWPKGAITDGSLPKLDWIARNTDEIENHNFIYHATSRFVHFSVAELLRRAWGNPYTKTMSITSLEFHDYWGYFSLYWGLDLFLKTLIELNFILGSLSDEEEAAIHEAAKQIGRMGKPPIITAEELDWPTDSSSA